MGCGSQNRISGVCNRVSALSCVDAAEKNITKSKTKQRAQRTPGSGGSVSLSQHKPNPELDIKRDRKPCGTDVENIR